ncbi:MAG: endonuclease MutS2, partial [Cyclobacteriaceae bacterium]
MLYPKNFEEKLNFEKIRELLTGYCLSSLGARYVEKLRFSADFDKIDKWQKQTAEFKRIIEQQEPFPASNYIDALQHLHKGKVPGSFYSEEELFDIALSLKTIVAALTFLKKRSEDYPVLFELANPIEVDANLIGAIEKIVDEKGQIKDNASPELSSLRSQIRKQEVQLRTTVQSILKNAISKGYTEEGVTVALRNGRLVIPVNAANKRQLKGYIQDESSTG